MQPTRKFVAWKSDTSKSHNEHSILPAIKVAGSASFSNEHNASVSSSSTQPIDDDYPRERRTIPSFLSAKDLSILREFRARELEKRRLNGSISPIVGRLSVDQVRCLEQERQPTIRPKSSKPAPDFVLDHERKLYEEFVHFSAGSVAFKASAKIFKVSRFGIESKEEKVAYNQGLLSSEGKRGVTLDLRECLEFCKSTRIVPVVSGPENDRNLKVYKTDVSSIEYTLVVSTFKTVENLDCELDFERFTQFIYKLFTVGLAQLDSRLDSTIQRRAELQLKMTKYLQSTPNPHKRIKEIFAELFNTIYEAFVFFDNEGTWQISAATFMHLCKNVLYLPLTMADLKLTLEEIGWLQTISAHDFVQGFAWHPLGERRAVAFTDRLVVPAPEAALYQAFCFFSRYQAKGMGEVVPSLAQVQSSPAGPGPHHVSFQQLVEFLKFAGIVPTRTVRSITGETLYKTDVGSPEYDAAVKAFRATVEREDLMEWIEFKECLFQTIRGGGRRLKKELLHGKNLLYGMRAKMSNFAPSVTNPLQALKLALRSRFDSVFDAFVYFDTSGSWSVSVAEFKSMVKLLGLTLTVNDIDVALREICALNSTSFSASEFCSKLNWADSAAKETQRMEIREHEAELFELFETFCRGKEKHPNPSRMNDGRGQVMNLGEFLQFAKFTDLMPVEVELKPEAGAERVKINRHSIQYAIAVKVFQSVNWTNEKECEVSWPEFKEVIYQYFKAGPQIARDILQETEEELQTKYAQFCDNIVSVADPIVALKNTLRARFNNVFDAFAFMDLNGDWEVSANEMTMAFNDLALGLTRADLFAVIRRIMKRSTVDAALVISPHEFVKVLAWHPRPSQGGIQNALEIAKSHRETTAEAALQKAAQNPFPKPKPSFQHLRAEDAEEYRRLETTVAELKKIINELEKTFTFRNIQVELLAMSAEDKETRRQNARMRLRERAAQSNEKTMFQLLDESRSRRSAIISEASKRTRENRDTPQRYQGEPPPVETLLMYACKRDKDAMMAQVEKNRLLEAAMKKLTSLNNLLGVPIRDLPMSAKERFAREEQLTQIREARKKALLGEEKIAGQFIEDAKRNRKAIVDSAVSKAMELKKTWDTGEAASEVVTAVFDWIQKKARSEVIAAASTRIPNHETFPHVTTKPRPILSLQDDNGREGKEGSSGADSQASATQVPRDTEDASDATPSGETATVDPSAQECHQMHKTSSGISHDDVEAKSDEPSSSPIVLSHDVFRFGRKRDFNLLHSTCCEVVRIQTAVSHLKSIRDRGICGVSIQNLSKQARLEARLALLPPQVLLDAATVMQRLCRAKICWRRMQDAEFWSR